MGEGVRDPMWARSLPQSQGCPLSILLPIPIMLLSQTASAGVLRAFPLHLARPVCSFPELVVKC